MPNKWELKDVTPDYDQSWLRLLVMDGERIVAEVNVPEAELDQAVSDIWKIIAAPDLLDACEAFMIDWYRPVHTIQEQESRRVRRLRIREMITDAISKARVGANG